jgi:hypothetical protein
MGRNKTKKTTQRRRKEANEEVNTEIKVKDISKK